MESQKKPEGSFFQEINFFTLSLRFWKEQIFFCLLATLSCLWSFVISSNSAQYLIKRDGDVLREVTIFSFKFNFQSVNHLLLSLFLLIISYALIVFSHVLYSYYLENKVLSYIKEVISKKIFSLENYSDDQKKNLVSLLTHNLRTFSQFVFFVPNQIYYCLIDLAIVCYSFKSSSFNSDKRLLVISVLSVLSILLSSYFLHHLFYNKEIKYQKELDNEIKRGLLLVNNRELIIKKNQINKFSSFYRDSLLGSSQSWNSRALFQTLYFVFPSYFLVNFLPFLLLFWSKNAIDLGFIVNFSNFLRTVKKTIERMNEYPLFFSSQKKINDLLLAPDFDNINDGVRLDEKIHSVSFENVSFSYGKNLVLKDFSFKFESGNLNRMDFPNGFGKSTILRILFRLEIPTSGKIFINDKYLLSELNVEDWRRKFSFFEHRNLIFDDNLSTGQKQITDLKEIIVEDHSAVNQQQILVFDEADSNLDTSNRELFLSKVKLLSKDRIVILVSHLLPSRGLNSEL